VLRQAVGAGHEGLDHPPTPRLAERPDRDLADGRVLVVQQIRQPWHSVRHAERPADPCAGDPDARVGVAQGIDEVGLQAAPAEGVDDLELGRESGAGALQACRDHQCD